MARAHGLLTERIWVDPEPCRRDDALADLCSELDVSEGLGRILISRNLACANEASRFLNPCAEHLHDPFLMAGMEAAVARIRRAINRFEKIVVFGDYDVDGTASTAILYNYLKRLGARVHYFIPERLTDGYGLSMPVIDRLHEGRADLLITVDNGSTAHEESRYLRGLGIDLIVTDHHRMGAERPETVALVNPQQPGCAYPFKDLSATGVAYKVACALDAALEEERFWDQRGLCHTRPDYFLDLVALATVADMSPLVGENRVLVKLGLEMINARPRPGLAGLMKECNVRQGLSPSAINFKLAPKINALGRIGDPKVGIQMLLTHSYTEGRKLARHLGSVNRMRQDIERRALSAAMKQVEAQAERRSLVLVGEDWHPGVIGIIATRVAYQFHKPTVVITLAQKGQALGSARGSGAFNILGALERCESLLDRYGGHVTAAGLALAPERVERFCRAFADAVDTGVAPANGPPNQRIDIDTWIPPEGLDCRFVEEIGRLSPFGYGNPEPVVAVRGLDMGHPSIFQNRHLKFQVVCPNGHGIDVVAWDQSAWARTLSGAYDVAFTPQVYYGADGLQTRLRVVDLKGCN